MRLTQQWKTVVLTFDLSGAVGYEFVKELDPQSRPEWEGCRSFPFCSEWPKREVFTFTTPKTQACLFAYQKFVQSVTAPDLVCG